MRKRFTALAVAAGTTAVLALGGWVPARAGVAQSAVVSENPIASTPWIKDGAVKAITEVGDTMIAGGTFTTVQPAGHKASTAVKRPYLVAFNRSSGKIDTAFAPQLDGQVKALAAGPHGTVYVGGNFKHVNGSSQRGVVQLQLSNGHRVGSFHGTLDNGIVETMALSHGKLYVGGTFSKIDGASRIGLARLNASTGALDKGLNLPIAKPRLGTLRVQNLAVNPQGTVLMIDGTFTEVAGHHRQQIAKIDTSGRTAKLADWATGRFAKCNRTIEIYPDGIDFAPDGSYFVVAATGAYRRGQIQDTYCDSATRWETSGTGHATPTWVNYTGGDSLYTVAVTGSAVYVGGHQRWLNNPHGQDSKGAGAVPRPGIAAINPKTGKALSWNPTKTRGHGVTALYADSRGLWEGCDTKTLANEYHPRIGFFPLPASARQPAKPTAKPTPSPTHLRASAAPSASPTRTARHQGAGDPPVTPSASPSSTSAAPTVSATHGAASTGGLPFTGAPIAWFGALAALLIIGGGAVLVINRQRRQHG